ncbi:MAG: MFS transporter [Sediminibacterium sp.]|nr:MFS transporter [Sediminibacterium sp.]
MNQVQRIPTNKGALTTLIVVFFFWGFIAAGNGVFIPFCKHKFNLDQFQSQLVDFAFYVAYFIGALVLFIYSAFGQKKDLVGFWGYKKSIVNGLLLSFIGSIIMIWAVTENSFYGMLCGLFIVALGFSIQQTAAQPFSIALGDPATGNGRVNFCGGMNSLGTTIGPIIVGFALFGKAALSDSEIAKLSLDKVIILYLGVGLLFIAAAALFYFSKKVPAGINTEKTEPAPKALWLLVIMTILLIACFYPIFASYNNLSVNNNLFNYDSLLSNIDALTLQIANSPSLTTQLADLLNIKLSFELYRLKWTIAALLVVVLLLLFAFYAAKKNSQGWGALKYPQLLLGMIAILVYVGVEVSIQSNLGELLRQKPFGGYSTSDIAPFISMYWGGLMMGRWAGAIGAFDFKKSTQQLLTIVLPLVAFALVLGVNALANHNIEPLLWYILCVFVQIGAFLYCRNRPATTLLVFGLLGIIAMICGVLNVGLVSVYCFLAGGLCCSIMWPAIFSLSIAGLGKYTTQGSAFLIMMILGGGIIPPIQGKLSDYLQNLHQDVEGYGIHHSYWIPVICFAYLFLFAYLVRKALKKQGIDFENVESAGGH